MSNILESLLLHSTRSTTCKTYFKIWQGFNKFIVRLDVIPDTWEERTALYCAYLVDKGVKSTTLRSYVSGIKGILKGDKHKWKWDDEQVVLSSLIKACKIMNDKLTVRLPIHEGLLELMLFETQRIMDKQPYLEILYKTMLSVGYYGLLRVGELTVPGQHTIKDCNIHVAKNKEKILIVLYSSKTHGEESYPQKVKISGNATTRKHRFFCPFVLIKQYLPIRGGFIDDQEPFFVFRDKMPVMDSQFRGI